MSVPYTRRLSVVLVSLAALAAQHEAFHARIWGGLHFRDAMVDGYALGHQAAELALRRIR